MLCNGSLERSWSENKKFVYDNYRITKNASNYIKNINLRKKSIIDVRI